MAIVMAVMVVVVVVVVVVIVVSRLYNSVVSGPNRLRDLLKKQGINGPPPTFLVGNIFDIKKSRSLAAAAASNSRNTESKPISHNIAAVLFPFLEQWKKQYGELFVFSLGNTPIVMVNESDMVKAISTCVSLDLGKPSYQQRNRGSLLGHGILTSNGSSWAFQRKIIAPQFSMEKVKGMNDIICECSLALVNSWNNQIKSHEDRIIDINIDEHIRKFSGDVISRASFGSNYSQGEMIFDKLRALQKLESEKTFSTGMIPGMRHVPTKSNREIWALEKEVRDLILEVVREREFGRQSRSDAYEKDFLDVVLEGAKSSDMSRDSINQFIVDNCKNIYLAGFETTAVSTTWCLMLLALNQEWQDRVRTEVLEVCAGQLPDANMIRKMKNVTMVINETLRLYPPVSVISREALKDMKFGNLYVAKGVNVWSMALTSHTDPELWGPDSYEFNPDRFANGITGACKQPHMYMPFGVGPRVCLGQFLAVVEIKMLVALIVSNFSFTLSPKYVHSPIMTLLTEPEFGVNLLVKKL